MIEYKIKKIGKLKYSRISSMSKLRKSLNGYGFTYNMTEIKEILDKLLDGFEEQFCLKYKISFDLIFDNNEYVEYNDETEERNFPINFIPPIGNVL